MFADNFRRFLDSHDHIDLPIGTVCVIKFTEPFPPMARRMTFDEGRQYRSELQQIMGAWSIVAFDYGKMDGPGYGCKLHEDYDQ